jgi:predicted GH43/DUF377 family glycosyl hydrolase
MKKFLYLISVMIFAFSICGCKANNIDDNTINDSVDASEYDFGNSESWLGESINVVDLGDCIIDAYPFDDKYDWGQSIMYDEGIYKMWWCRQSPYDTIWYAESTDLKSWTNSQKIMTVKEDSTWIKMHVGKPTVIKVNEKYIMYLEAPATRYTDWTEYDNNILMATSDNGIDWQYYTDGTDEPQPVIRMTEEQMNKKNYGIGQPSALYKDGLYYIYYTYSVGEGDRMYMSTSTDGIHFGEGVRVFDRAGCGVKYNNIINKFVFNYEYTVNGLSNIYYMESDDGINFTYNSLSEANGNKNIISQPVQQVRGYPSFIADGNGQINSYTMYACYMEGNMATSGDWRTYSYTWDIHISAFNINEFANRKMVLPNNKVYTDDTFKTYTTKHNKYEMPLWKKIYTSTNNPVIDGEIDSCWEKSTELKINRISSNGGAVPTNSTGSVKMIYSKNSLYLLSVISDENLKAGDSLFFIIDEKDNNSLKSEVTHLKIEPDGTYEFTDADKNNLVTTIYVHVKIIDGGYVVEICMDWRFAETATVGQDFGFDSYIYDNFEDENFSILAWNDYSIISYKTFNYLGDIEIA